jgi:hypothetical protein
LNSRGEGVGSAVGIATGVKSGVATTPGTLTNGDGAPGKIGTEGCVCGGGPGGGAGACARATPASVASASIITIVRRVAQRAADIDVGKILIAEKFSSYDAAAYSRASTLGPAPR